MRKYNKSKKKNVKRRITQKAGTSRSGSRSYESNEGSRGRSRTRKEYKRSDDRENSISRAIPGSRGRSRRRNTNKREEDSRDNSLSRAVPGTRVHMGPKKGRPVHGTLFRDKLNKKEMWMACDDCKANASYYYNLDTGNAEWSTPDYQYK